jgi:hypothetical protein
MSEKPASLRTRCRPGPALHPRRLRAIATVETACLAPADVLARLGLCQDFKGSTDPVAHSRQGSFRRASPSGCWPKVRAGCCIPVGAHTAEAAFDPMQLRLDASLAFIAPSVDRVDALGNELARLCMRVSCVGQRDKRTEKTAATTSSSTVQSKNSSECLTVTRPVAMKRQTTAASATAVPRTSCRFITPRRVTISFMRNAAVGGIVGGRPSNVDGGYFFLPRFLPSCASACSTASHSVFSTLMRAKYLLLASTRVHGVVAVEVRSTMSHTAVS